MTTTEEVLTLAREIASAWDCMTEVDQPEPNRLNIRLTKSEDLIPIITMLRVKRLGYLVAITGLDQGAEQGTLEVLYHFCTAAATLTVRVQFPREEASIPTLSEIIPSAEPFERELSEMFGVTVSGLDAPEHLYLPDDWPGATYPLRKDFDEQVLQPTEKTEAQQTGTDQSPISNIQEVNNGE
jgi:NADH:ubiquinone oxidoreductase subunit C